MGGKSPKHDGRDKEQTGTGGAHETPPVPVLQSSDDEVVDAVRDAMASKLSDGEERRISRKLKAIVKPLRATDEETSR